VLLLAHYEGLPLLVETVAMLRDGFWPITQFASILEDQIIEDGSVCEEFDKDDFFVGRGRINLHLLLSFTQSL
jgi:hypothetical protein